MTCFRAEVLLYRRGASVTILELVKIAPGVYRGNAGHLFDYSDDEVYPTRDEARAAAIVEMREIRRQIDSYLEGL